MTCTFVEHNLDVLKTADWIIDLGPEGGERGGFIVAEGTPEQICQAHGRPSVGGPAHTACFLGEVLQAGPQAERPRYDPHAANKPRSDDVALEAVGKDAKMPWETDGRRWHSSERVSLNGKPSRWEVLMDDVPPLLARYEGVAPDKIELIPNWVLLPIAHRAIDSRNRFRAPLQSKFVVGLSGNLGFTHAPATVFEAARLLRQEFR